VKGPRRTRTIHVRDAKKLEAVKVGDPVVAKYYRAVIVQVKKAGTATPGVTAQQAATSKPGTTPAGAVAQQATVTAPIVRIADDGRRVAIQGPDGHTEVITVRDPKNVAGMKVGDLVEITYTRARAISLDKSPAN
jgi:hypothetical protein